MNGKILGQSKRKKQWGRHMIIESLEKLQEVTELIKSSLPINMQLQLNDACTPSCNQPVAFHARARNLAVHPTPASRPAELRLSLLIDETLGWVLPLQFSIGPLLTAAEIIQKIADACYFLQSWSHSHSAEARRHLRSEHPSSTPNAGSGRKPVIQ